MKIWFSSRATSSFRIADETPREATLGPAGFRELLRRECARSDRNGHQFALVDLRMTETSQKAVGRLVDVVWERVRATDSAGWIEEPTRLGAVLFECPEAAAHRFGTHVSEHMAADGVSVSFDIHVYPGALPSDLASDVSVPGRTARTSAAAGKAEVAP